MLLLTDRPQDSQHLQQTLRQVAPCTVVDVQDASSHPPGDALIVCDVALDSMASLELVQAALAHHRASVPVPVLCLTRDPSLLTQSQARALAAAAILPCQSAPRDLIEATRELMSGGAPQEARSPVPTLPRDVRVGVQTAGAALNDLFVAAKSRKPVSVSSLDRGGEAVLAVVRGEHLRAWLDLVRTHDDVTYQHCLLVAGLAAAFAVRLGLTVKGQRLLSQAALVHDIGKAHVPSGILNKPGRLSPEEASVMRTHAAVGHQFLLQQKGVDPLLLDVVRHHHEYLDGSGYPDGLKGTQISQVVRVITICDIYAAMIERRAYKSPASPSKALDILAEMGPKLDGDLLRVFGSVVRGS